jgi:chromosome segregation ATPase
MDEEIARLEAEHAELEGPPQEISWDELVAKSAKYERELEARERRRGILPRLITAAKVKRLELQREQWARQIEPLEAERDAAYERMEAAEAKLHEAHRERGLAQEVWSDARWRIQSREQRIRAIDREMRELRGGR